MTLPRPASAIAGNHGPGYDAAMRSGACALVASTAFAIIVASCSRDDDAVARSCAGACASACVTAIPPPATAVLPSPTTSGATAAAQSPAVPVLAPSAPEVPWTPPEDAACAQRRVTLASLDKSMSASLWTFRSEVWNGYVDFRGGNVYSTHWGLGRWSIDGPGRITMKNDYDGFVHRIVIDSGGTRYTGVRNDGIKISGKLVCAGYAAAESKAPPPPPLPEPKMGSPRREDPTQRF